MLKFNLNKLDNYKKKFFLIFSDFFIIIFSIVAAYSLRLEKIYSVLEIDFRVYLLQELKRINTLVQESLDLEDVKEDSDMIKTTKLVLEKINSFSVSSVGDKEMLKILKMQNLVNEYTKDDN